MLGVSTSVYVFKDIGMCAWATAARHAISGTGHVTGSGEPRRVILLKGRTGCRPHGALHTRPPSTLEHGTVGTGGRRAPARRRSVARNSSTSEPGLGCAQWGAHCVGGPAGPEPCPHEDLSRVLKPHRPPLPSTLPKVLLGPAHPPG